MTESQRKNETSDASNSERPSKIEHGYDRRTLLGQVVSPIRQFRYSFAFLGISVLSLCAFVLIAQISFSQKLSVLESTYHLTPEVIEGIEQSIGGMLWSAFSFAIAVSILSFVIGLRISHHFYGPIIPIRRHIEELKAGNFSSRIQLRENDELTDLQDALNELAEALQDRGSVESTPRLKKLS